MKHASSRCRTFRRNTFTRRLLAPIMAASVVASASQWKALAQESFSCGVSGFCLSGNLTNILGLPNGTLNIVTYHPWDYVLHGPKPGATLEEPWRAAVAAWRPLEGEARATLSALHGVANDFRLPNAAASDVRTQMLMRLIAIAKKKAQGGSLTGVERDAVDAMIDLIVARRVRIAQLGLDEYARWQSNPCHYTVPVRQSGESFGFEQYDPGFGCGLPGTVLAGPPRPPTADQFKAYGAALGLEPFINADRDAAWREFDQSLALAVGVLSAAVVSGVAAVLAVAIPAVASTFAVIAGSSAATFGFFTSTLVAGSTFAATSAGIVGAATAAALPAFVIISVVVAALYIVQFVEDQSILPELQQTLDEARVAPDIWAMSQDSNLFGELLSTFLIPTSPEWSDEERPGAEAAKVGPSQRGPGDPRFDVGGILKDSIFTWNSAGRLQETFMSQGWFVTRTRAANGVWGPWQWRLSLDYRPGTLASQTTRLAGIQPTGFLDAPNSSNTTAGPAVKKTSLSILDETLQSRTVTWAGNHAPTLAPTVSEQPIVSTPVTFRANASDSDPGNTITGIRWFIQDPTFDPPRKSADECTFNPPGKIDPVSGFPYSCPWVPLDDNGDSGINYTFARPGTWGVRVLAMDSEGAIASQQFTVNIGNLVPTLTITPGGPLFVLPPTVPNVDEGQTVALIGGTLNYPGLGDGSWGALTTLVVDWGDGQVTRRAYPCNVDGTPESDRGCLINVGSGGAAVTFVKIPSDPPLPVGPWPFNLSHVYTHNPNQPIAFPAQIKVYAITTLNARTETLRFNVTVNDVPPVFEPAPICPFFSGDSLIKCLVGDQRTIPAGSTVDLRGRIYDVAGATHSVNLLWGDGTSSLHPAGCTSTGCPGFAAPWFQAAPPPPGSLPSKFVGFQHVYETLGIHPLTLVVDDGAPDADGDEAPDGEVTYASEMIVFGITAPTGATEVNAGEAIPYTFTSVGTDGTSSAPVTPTCEGGSAGNITASSFTCLFNDVGAETTRKVKLQAVVGGYPFERTLDVKVKVRPTTISPLSGPTTVTAGTRHTYTFTASHSTVGGLTFFLPSCGAQSIEIVSTSSSITCKFNAVTQPSISQVAITIAAPGGSATSSLDVTVLPDLAPPDLSLPQNIVANSSSNSGRVVNYTATATDAVSGSAAVTCAPHSGSQFAVGTTTVSCAAGDWVFNVATGEFSVTILDVTPPTLTLSQPFALDATAPSGAVATYQASATEAPLPPPALQCAPMSGSIFPIGTTNVACTAIDAAGNTAQGQIAITVHGAADQVAALHAYVQAEAIDAALKKRLLSALNDAAKSLQSGRGNTCGQLAGFAAIVDTSGKKLTPSQIQRMLTDVARIQAVVGC
jgi:hypothetical protein